MFVNEMPRYEILSEDAMAVLDRGWRRIVAEIGIEFLLPEAVELLRDAGQIIEDENRVRFDPEFILEQVAKAPKQFELQARNPQLVTSTPQPTSGSPRPSSSRAADPTPPSRPCPPRPRASSATSLAPPLTAARPR